MTTTPKTVPDSLKLHIQLAYRALMANGGKRRRGQQIMIGEIAKAVANATHRGEDASSARMLAVQAPTGSGKSYAYGIGVIPVAIAAGLKTIISTATVQLQEQLICKDMVALKSVLPEMNAVLVKGRGRYACPVRLMQAARGEGEGDQTKVREAATALATQFANQTWGGDVDDLPTQPDPQIWHAFTNDRNGCSGKRCSQYGNCPYYSARKQIESANVLVVNHSLLLLDMATGNHILPNTDESVIIIDEAHELPTVALASLQGRSALEEGKRWVIKASRVISALRANSPKGEIGQRCVEISDCLSTLSGCLTEAQMAIQSTGKTTNVRDPERAIRFAMGKLPEWLANVAAQCKDTSAQLMARLQALIGTLNEEGTLSSDKLQEQFVSELGKVLGHLESVVLVWHLMNESQVDGAPVAKWVEIDREKDDLHICASPVGVGQYLHEALWSKCASSIHLSATLTSVGGFTQYLRESGLALCGNVPTLQVESPFDFQRQASICVPKGIANPKNTEQHTADLIDCIKGLLSGQRPGEGALCVFTSWKQLKQVVDAMPHSILDRLLVQGAGLSKREIIARHKAAIDAGQRSAIFGVASFETGVDLPGNYATLVVISKLQFAVPTDPVAQAHKEFLDSVGRSYFDEVVLPHTGRRLAQTTGRLIRSEDDFGQIVIADTRLTSTVYGRAMLKALPNYRLTTEMPITTYQDYVGLQPTPW